MVSVTALPRSTSRPSVLLIMILKSPLLSILRLIRKTSNSPSIELELAAKESDVLYASDRMTSNAQFGGNRLTIEKDITKTTVLPVKNELGVIETCFRLLGKR